MDDIDEKIREALRDSGGSRELFEEKGVFAEVLTPFKGKRRWVNFVGLAYGTVANVVGFWAGYRAFVAEDIRSQLLWSGLCLLALMFVAFSKIYFWMEMHSNRILREVKRVELLFLSKQGSKDDD